GAVPWNEAEGRRIHTDNDDAGLRWYLEAIYGITGKEKIYDGIMLVAMERAFNDLKDYLWGLTWDGVKRVDTLLSDYLGAEEVGS
ncbi:virulence-associated E family protein, partial [Pseudomonas aeruginosa]|uniref:virulence-associated E family protein n=1 Tax=Pseudomonas aeruginosa TaxID=287 RepID=UPI001F4B8BBA